MYITSRPASRSSNMSIAAFTPPPLVLMVIFAES